jgi:hypothetical protein
MFGLLAGIALGILSLGFFLAIIGHGIKSIIRAIRGDKES